MTKRSQILLLTILICSCRKSAVFKVQDPSRDTTFRASIFSKSPTSIIIIVNGSLDGEFVVGGKFFAKGTYVNDSTVSDWYQKDSLVVPYYSRGAKIGNLEIKATVQ